MDAEHPNPTDSSTYSSMQEAYFANIPMARPVSIESIRLDTLDAAASSDAFAPLARMGIAWAIVQMVAMVGAVIVAFILLIVIGVVASVAGIIEIPKSQEGISIPDPYYAFLMTAFIGVVCVLAALVMTGFRRPNLHAMGWRTSSLRKDIIIGIVVTIPTYLAVTVIMAVAESIDPKLVEGSKLLEALFSKMSIPLIVMFLTVVAIWEEVVFRGFLLTRLQAIFKRWWLSVLIGAAPFAICHYDQGVLGVVVVGGLGVVFSLLFLWRRSLVPAIVCHFFYNLTGVLLERLTSS